MARTWAGFVIDDSGYVIVRTADREAESRMRLVEWTEATFRDSGRASIELAASDDERELRDARNTRAGSSPVGHRRKRPFDNRLVANQNPCPS